MTNLIVYTRYAYRTFLWVFALVTLPFIALKLGGFSIPELPFMFLALLGLIKFYLASLQNGKALQDKIRGYRGAGASKQDIVDHVSKYRTSQDLALLANGVLVMILNIAL